MTIAKDFKDIAQSYAETRRVVNNKLKVMKDKRIRSSIKEFWEELRKIDLSMWDCGKIISSQPTKRFLFQIDSMPSDAENSPQDSPEIPDVSGVGVDPETRNLTGFHQVDKEGNDHAQPPE